GPASTARAFAATFLEWGRLSARDGKRSEELKALMARAENVLASERAKGASSVRVTLTWAHPELHPILFTNALGSPMPAPEGDATLGIAQARLPARPGTFVEVRLEKNDVEEVARLGAIAVLTATFEELGTNEKIVRVPIKFERAGPATLRFKVE